MIVGGRASRKENQTAKRREEGRDRERDRERRNIVIGELPVFLGYWF